ncbi:fimbrial protein, partial [Haemophilus parahaemolyticus]
MKKTILALLALGAFGVAHADATNGDPRTPISTIKEPGHEISYQRATTAADGSTKTHAKITVKGKVLDSTCEIKTESRNQTVQLKSVGVNQLTKVGDVAADHLVQIKLENCKTKAVVGAGTTAGTGTDKVTVTFNATNKIDNY